MIKFLPVIICAILALGVGRNIIFWALIAYLIGFWALVPLVLLPTRPEKRLNAVKHQEEIEKFKKELKHL